jgi:hypothetical protein
VISDYSFDENWRRALSEMTAEPPGGPAPGTRVHEVVRFAGRRFVTDSVVTDVDPGVSYEFTGSGSGGDVQGSRTVESAAHGDSAVFTYAIEIQPPAVLRALRGLLAPMFRSGLRKDLQRLKALLEATVSAPGTYEQALRRHSDAPEPV